jgi:hypothetical protein
MKVKGAAKPAQNEESIRVMTVREVSAHLRVHPTTICQANSSYRTNRSSVLRSRKVFRHRRNFCLQSKPHPENSPCYPRKSHG